MLINKYTWEEIAERFSENIETGKEDFKTWFKKKETFGVKFDKNFYRLLYRIHKKINFENSDFFIVFCGKEGTGKSTFSINASCILDENMILDRICFKPMQFIEAISISDKGNAIVIDEGNLIMFSRESMSNGNKDMVKILALMRQRNLAVSICVPNFWTLDTYTRDHRVNCVVNIEERGKYTAYIGKAIPLISKYGRDTKSFDSVKVPHGTFWRGYFNDGIVEHNDINEASYKEHKQDTFNEFINELKASYQEKEQEKLFITANEASRIMGVDPRTIKSWIKKGTITGRKIGGRMYLEKAQILNLTMT